MMIIPLQQIPRQNFKVILDDVQFEITLLAVSDCMHANVISGGTTIISGTRCVAGYQLLPYRRLEGLTGNFIFSTQNDELPWWENFGVDQVLYYLDADELAAVRA